jgi:hypothetical protein
MALADVTDWMDEFGVPDNVWYAKRLAANDTLANASHQAGPYFPKEILFSLFPALNKSSVENPDVRFPLYVDSHPDHREVRAVWYNKKLFGKGTRNETRLTGFGGQHSALLDPDSTGTLTIFAFKPAPGPTGKECHVWVCRDGTEEDLFEDRLGPVEPKEFKLWKPGMTPEATLFTTEASSATSCHLARADIPAEWLKNFPSGEVIIQKTIERRPPTGMDADVRLLRRRQCEYEMFQSIEEATFLPKIKAGFSSIDTFTGLAQSILQSRKSRSGNSLELHAREIMREEGLVAEKDFSHRPVIENGKRPDFIFPSAAAYETAAFPTTKLRMLAAKTTCKDRWRQVLNEADRISKKHLLTLQEGVSVGQFKEMSDAGVLLVVPVGLHKAYPKSIRQHLISFESFLGDVRLLNISSS